MYIGTTIEACSLREQSVYLHRIDCCCCSSSAQDENTSYHALAKPDVGPSVRIQLAIAAWASKVLMGKRAKEINCFSCPFSVVYTTTWFQGQIY